MKRLILLVYLGIISISIAPAQSGIEVQYVAPRANAKGDYSEGTLYTLWCKAEHSLFFKGATPGELDLDEKEQKLVLNFATGKNWIYKDRRQSQMTNWAPPSGTSSIG